MPRAILSVSDKTGIVDLGRGLAARGFELISTGGTARALSDAGLAVIPVSDVTGFPEMMDGRVKTLHPAIHGGILARRDRPDDLAALARQGIGLIDLVVVNLYPFVRAASNAATPIDDLVEEIDIGGPSLVRAAAKNFRHTMVVVQPTDYSRALDAIDRGPTLAFRLDLMQTAFAHTAAYDSAIAQTLLGVSVEDGTLLRRNRPAEGHPAAQSPRGGDPVASRSMLLTLEKLRDLRYGENPQQKAAWYADAGARGFSRATVLQGKELSYTNLLDLMRRRGSCLSSRACRTVIKHTNPCGAATGESAAEAYVRARDAGSLAAFGGIVGLNRAIDVKTAGRSCRRSQAVIAPALRRGAACAGEEGQHARGDGVLDVSADGGVELRSILGAVLTQERDRVIEAREPWRPGSLPEGVRVVTKREPSPEEWEALRFAWRVCAHVKSNTVIFTDARRTLAIGAGQMSRVDAVNVAVAKAASANVVLQRSVAASDAFFPFRDGLDAVALAGATAIVQPGGSVRDAEVIAAADEHGLAMIFTGRRHFRH
jgi:phosphoribosylaminoimidazolecarboxamide formyltransferase/IMP cyclohydrolase